MKRFKKKMKGIDKDSLGQLTWNDPVYCLIHRISIFYIILSGQKGLVSKLDRESSSTIFYTTFSMCFR